MNHQKFINMMINTLRKELQTIVNLFLIFLPCTIIISSTAAQNDTVSQNGTAVKIHYVAVSFPFNTPEKKWEMAIPDSIPDWNNYEYDHLIVGTGGRIFGSVSSSCADCKAYPYIVIFNPDGYSEKVIPCSELNSPIEYFVEGSDGYLFFCATSSEEDKVILYRLNPKNEYLDTILTIDFIGDIENPIKIDREDNLFFTIQSRLPDIGSRLYCVDLKGNIIWNKELEPNSNVHASIPSIDEYRNKVYLNFYTSTNCKSHVIALDRSSGEEFWKFTFPNRHLSYAMARPPSIGEDGTVYITCHTTLFALSEPYGYELWRRDFHPSYLNTTPSIGSDGTLYIKNGHEINEVWNPGFITAVNPSDGSVKWETMISPALGYYDYLIDDIYSSENNMVLFSFSRNDSLHLAVLRDNENTGRILWSINYGGQLRFGVDNTLFLIPETIKTSIYAFAPGNEKYLNISPDKPSNPSPYDGEGEIDTLITLKWSCYENNEYELKYDVLLGVSPDSLMLVTTGLSEEQIKVGGLDYKGTYFWKVIASNNQITTEGPLWVFYVRSLLISKYSNDISLDSISIFPNPTKGFIMIQGLKADATAAIYSLQGQKLRFIKMTPGDNAINIGELERGMYLLRFTSKQKTYDFKIIKE